jgi:hypothetical protein
MLHKIIQNSANTQIMMLDDIRRDVGTQSRMAIDWKHVKLLEEQMLSGEKTRASNSF